MKSSYEVRARLFIEKVFPFIEDCEEPNEYAKAIKRYNKLYHRKVHVDYGMTRVVLITSDYVIKIDYGTSGCIWGSCRNEYQVYKLAERDGYDYLFAKITPVAFKGRVFYIMPRIHGIGSSRSDGYDVDEWLTEEENDWLNVHCRDLHHENYGWHNYRPVIIDYACRIQLENYRFSNFPKTLDVIHLIKILAFFSNLSIIIIVKGSERN